MYPHEEQVSEDVDCCVATGVAAGVGEGGGRGGASAPIRGLEIRAYGVNGAKLLEQQRRPTWRLGTPSYNQCRVPSKFTPGFARTLLRCYAREA